MEALGDRAVRMPWPYVPGVCAGMRTGEHLTAYTGRIQRRRVKRISAAAALAIGDQFDMVAACRRPGMAIASWRSTKGTRREPPMHPRVAVGRYGGIYDQDM